MGGFIDMVHERTLQFAVERIYADVSDGSATEFAHDRRRTAGVELIRILREHFGAGIRLQNLTPGTPGICLSVGGDVTIHADRQEVVERNARADQSH